MAEILVVLGLIQLAIRDCVVSILVVVPDGIGFVGVGDIEQTVEVAVLVVSVKVWKMSGIINPYVIPG